MADLHNKVSYLPDSIGFFRRVRTPNTAFSRPSSWRRA